jgi:signal transduction histidine kinase/FixJ family two-component response regulator
MQKILIIDKDPALRSLRRKILGTECDQVMAVPNINEAKKILSAQSIDMVLFDMASVQNEMPEMIRKLKAFSPHTEIITINGQISIRNAVKAIKAGAFDFVSKPYDMGEMIAKVKKCMQFIRNWRQENVFRETTNLYSMTHQLAKNWGEDKLLEYILGTIARIFKADHGCVQLFSKETNSFYLMADFGGGYSEAERAKIQRAVLERIASEKESIILNDDFGKEAKNSKTKRGMVSTMLAPLVINEEMIGLLAVSRRVKLKKQRFDMETLESLKVFSIHAASVINSLRHARAIVELDTLKTQFLSNVSHELRTPMMSIKGAIEMLHNFMRNLAIDEKLDQLVNIINRNAERMYCLVNDLLDFSRLELKKENLLFTNFALSELIKEIVVEQAEELSRKKLTFTQKASSDGLKISADRELLKQALHHLISNAIKFSNENCLISLDYGIDDGKIKMTVRDEGIGIPKEKIERIFDKFYQIDGTMSRKYPGVGLGLSIAKSIIDAHKGTISVESEVGKGSRFEITLPPQGTELRALG